MAGDERADDTPVVTTAPPEYGETWVYESIAGAFPGVDVSDRAAVAIQFASFEAGVLALAAVYGLPRAAIVGSVAVLVAAVGSAFMLDIGSRARRLDAPPTYSRLLFASSAEVVLGVLAYVAVLTYLFVHDPRAGAAPPLLASLFGDAPPLPAVLLALLILWDLCYRIGAAWWSAVAACWLSLRADLDPRSASELRAVDRRTIGFAAVQSLLVPPVVDHPLLVGAVVGHVGATLLVAGLSLALSAPTRR